MRRDYKDVIINTARVWDYSEGWRDNKIKEVYPLDLDDESKDVVVRIKKTKGKDKQFRDRLIPLVRFLEANIGRKWDDVYSDLCRYTDTRCVRGWHMRQHIFDYVSVSNSYRKQWPWVYRWRLYVDENGILCRES